MRPQTRLERIRIQAVMVKHYSDLVIAADAIFDRFGVKFATQDGFPGIDMFGFVKVAVGEQSNWFRDRGPEHFLSSGNFPRIENVA